jgi:putative NADH-flavin reductase
MKLLVLGATGGTGLEVIRLAKERGHAVTALVRNPEKLARFDSRIGVIKGDLLSRSELEAAVQGQDAVLSAFGPLADKVSGLETIRNGADGGDDALAYSASDGVVGGVPL